MITRATKNMGAVYVELGGKWHNVSIKAIFVINGWTRVEDEGRYYKQSTQTLTSEDGRENLKIDKLTNDPVIIALIRFYWLDEYFGGSLPGDIELPVPTAVDAEFINKNWDGMKPSARNRRLFDIYLPHLT